MRTIFGLLIAGVLAAGAAGCGVRSKVIVTTDPPEAEVTMNGVHLGKTPLEQPFTWYWYYDFIATKEGYQPTGSRERFRAPVYLWPGLDLLMEMMPFYVRDTKRVHLVLEPLDERPEPLLVQTAEPEAAKPAGAIGKN